MSIELQYDPPQPVCEVCGALAIEAIRDVVEVEGPKDGWRHYERSPAGPRYYCKQHVVDPIRHHLDGSSWYDTPDGLVLVETQRSEHEQATDREARGS